MTAPALSFLVFVLLVGRHEYYFLAYCITGLVFLVASFLAGAFILYRSINRGPHGASLFYVFLGLAMSWLMALLVLAVLNVTPLCVGQDNGDGSNDLTLCMVQTVLVSLLYSPLVLLMSGAASLAASRLLSGKRD